MFFNVASGNTKKRWESSLDYERKKDTFVYI